MKKIISVFLSAAIGASAIASTTSSAEEKKTATEKTGMVILGDSIASGYTVKGNVKYNYGDICGDYLGCKVSNYAVPGYDTDDVMKLIDGMSAAQKKNVADAEYIVLSVGGNDIIEYVAKELLKYAAAKTDHKFINDGYTAADIPEKPNFNDMMTMLNIRGEDGLEDYAANGGFSALIELNTTVSKIGASLSFNDEDNVGYIANNIVPKMKQTTEKLKAINPDAKIYVQNIYQPIQLDPTFVDKYYGANKSKMLNIIRYQLENVMTAFDEEIHTIDGVEIVDIKSQFTSLDDVPTANKPGNAHYFVDVQKTHLTDADIHPNQKGHLAIAATILEKIGKLHDDDGLLRKIYDGFSDKADYPAIALETYKKVAGKEPVVTTTTTSTTTKKTTTTTTTSTTTTTKKPTTTTTTSTTTTTKKPTTTTTTSTSTTTKKPTTTTTTSTTTTTKKTTTTSTTTTSATTTSATTQPARKMGDINNDSRVDAVDASWALKEYASQSTGGSTLTAEQILVGDVDGNKKVDSVDASKILSYYAYLSNLEGEPMTITEFLGKKSK